MNAFMFWYPTYNGDKLAAVLANTEAEAKAILLSDVRNCISEKILDNQVRLSYRVDEPGIVAYL